MNNLRDIVFHALGQASRCWHDDDTLDSDGIIEMGNTLMDAIAADKNEAVKQALERERAMNPYLTTDKGSFTFSINA